MTSQDKTIRCAQQEVFIASFPNKSNEPHTHAITGKRRKHEFLISTGALARKPNAAPGFLT